MRRFKVIYFDTSDDSKRHRIVKALNEQDAYRIVKSWLMYNTSYQLGTVHDCIELKQRKS